MYISRETPTYTHTETKINTKRVVEAVYELKPYGSVSRRGMRTRERATALARGRDTPNHTEN